MTELHIFQAGSWQAMGGQEISLSAEDVRAMAAAYDPVKHEAPIVIGHPNLNAPAHGWVTRLREDAGGLFAQVDRVSAAFRDLVRTGRYRKISSSLLSPNAKGNPTPGVWHLNHVGFLGAAPPAVKGLQQAEFSAGLSEAVSFGAPRSESLSVAARQLNSRDTFDFVEDLARKGVVTPALRPMVEALLNSADADCTLALSSPWGGRTMDQVEAIKRLLSEMPPTVIFAELSGRDRFEPEERFEAPPGASVDPESEELRRRAMAYARQHNVDFRTAVRAVR